MNRGILHFDQENYVGAYTDCQRALELNPRLPEAWNMRGAILQQLHRLDDALADFNQCLQLKPDHSNALSNRASVWKAKGLWQAARADFDRALALNPEQAETWNNRGNLRVAQGDWYGALADYTQSLTRKPTATAYHNRSLVWRELGKLSEAEQDVLASQKLTARRSGF